MRMDAHAYCLEYLYMRWIKCLIPIIFFLPIIFLVVVDALEYRNNASSDLAEPPSSCEDFCSNNQACNSSSSGGSYCKSWQTVPVCYGFYWRETNQTNACYSPNDPTCPQAFPVICPNLPTTTPVPFDTCQVNCLVTPECAFGPKRQGSYCKLDNQLLPVCFGLYWRDIAETIPCYFPEDPTCPQTNPIRCG